MKIILTSFILIILLFSCKKEEEINETLFVGYPFETITQSGGYRIDSISTTLINSSLGSRLTLLNESYIKLSFEDDSIMVFVDCCEYVLVDSLISQIATQGGTSDKLKLDFSINHSSGVLDLSPDGVFNNPPENPRIVTYTYEDLSLEIGDYFQLNNDSVLIVTTPVEIFEIWYFTPIN